MCALDMPNSLRSRSNSVGMHGLCTYNNKVAACMYLLLECSLYLCGNLSRRQPAMLNNIFPENYYI